jgi:hypothetical protein
MLYPVELRAQPFKCSAPATANTRARAYCNRINYIFHFYTRCRRTPGAGIKRQLVGVEGFELSTSSSQSWRSTRLSYTPLLHRTVSNSQNIAAKRKGCQSTLRQSGAPGEIRTPDHQVRSLVLYPAELRARRSGIIPSQRILVNPKRTDGKKKRITE